MSTHTASQLIITLHGVGSSGSDLAALASVWGSALPGAAFASPNAPAPSSLGAGYQWFSVAGVTSDNRSHRVGEARTAFDAVLSAIIADHGFTDRLDRVALVGFSQGTIMALDAVASGRWPVGAVVGFSGRLASPLPLHPALKTPVLLVHGSADPVIPATESSMAAATLQALGASVETLILPGVAHTISAQGAARAGEFLMTTMAG